MTLPKELIQQIEEESKAYGRESAWYVEGAAKYALQLHTLQQENERLRRALEKIMDLDWDLNRSWAYDIADKALTAQPEGKGKEGEA